MEYRELGTSGLRVSAMAFGAWQLGDTAYWGSSADADADAAVAAAVDAGINLFDTAEIYGDGESERVLGRVIGARRDKALIASKVSPDHCAPESLRAACEASLRRLGTDVIDLYQVHWPCRGVSFDDACAAMLKLRDEGKIRAIGVSNYGPRDLAAWMKAGGCVSNQLGYSLLFRAIEFEIVPACIAHRVGVLAYMPLLQGLLAGRWTSIDEIPVLRRRTRHFSGGREGTRHGQDGCEDLLLDAIRGIGEIADALGEPMARVAIAWAMAQPGIASVIVGGRSAGQVARNAEAAALALEPDVIARLNAVTQPIKDRMGANADMWESAERSRIR